MMSSSSAMDLTANHSTITLASPWIITTVSIAILSSLLMVTCALLSCLVTYMTEPDGYKKIKLDEDNSIAVLFIYY
mgnify:FL=1